MKTLLLFVIAFSSSALACPKGAPNGYEVIAGQKERSYRSKDSTTVVLVKCGLKTNEEEMARALTYLGEVKVVRKGLVYVDIGKSGGMRIYTTLNSKPMQISVVAKSPEAMEKAAREIANYVTE